MGGLSQIPTTLIVSIMAVFVIAGCAMFWILVRSGTGAENDKTDKDGSDDA